MMLIVGCHLAEIKKSPTRGGIGDELFTFHSMKGVNHTALQTYLFVILKTI